MRSKIFLQKAEKMWALYQEKCDGAGLVYSAPRLPLYLLDTWHRKSTLLSGYISLKTNSMCADVDLHKFEIKVEYSLQTKKKEIIV